MATKSKNTSNEIQASPLDLDELTDLYTRILKHGDKDLAQQMVLEAATAEIANFMAAESQSTMNLAQLEATLPLVAEAVAMRAENPGK
jgi:hypothetical protein